MREKAFNLFNEAWNKLLHGEFYDTQNNTQIEYMLKSLWSSQYKQKLQHTILQSLPHLFVQTQVLERPPPFLHILIHLRDPKINIELQGLSIVDWVKSNASEPSTFQLLNLIETFGDQSNTDNFVKTIIKNMHETMDQEMLKAFAYMLYAKHQSFLNQLLRQFASFSDKSVLKDFAHAIGPKAVLMLATIMRPGDVRKLLE